MNDCPRGEIRDLLPELLHGSLDLGLRAEVEAHVRGCAACAAELELLRASRSALSRAPVIDREKIAAAVIASRRSGAAASRSRERFWRVAALAAAVVVMLVGAYWFASSPSARPEVAVTPPAVAPESAVVTPKGAVPAPDAPVAAATPRQSPAPAPAVSAPAEVAVALSLGDGELGDADLEALLADIRSLDAVPDEEPSALLELPPINGEVQR